VKQKTFEELLRNIAINPLKAKKSLSDKRLTLIEKKVIQGHLLNRDNKNDQILESFEGTPESEFAFVNAHKHLLLGIAKNSLSRFQEAEVDLKEALAVFNKIGQSYHSFTVFFNLFMVYSNQSKIKEMKSALRSMETCEVGGDTNRHRLLRCQFTMASEENDAEKARMYLDQLCAIKLLMSENDLSAHLVGEFMFLVKLGDLPASRLCLGEMKKYRKFHLSENFKFMKKMLDHLLDSEPIYVYEKDFKSVPLLYYQLSVIQSLEGVNLEEARMFWSKLQSISPDIYKQNFHYESGKCLFSLCLDKHSDAITNRPLTFEIIGKTLEEKVYMLLLNSKGPLPTGLIFESIWGRVLESKEDLKKISRVISQVKKLYGVEINFKKGTYEMVQVESQQMKRNQA
jgi:tetratricopeptide (TPR) repeat protein